MNKLYYGYVYVGEQDQEIAVVIDTSSDWLVIEGRGCITCKENKYDPNTSGYFAVVSD